MPKKREADMSYRGVRQRIAGNEATGYRGPDPDEAQRLGSVNSRSLKKAVESVGGRGSKTMQRIKDAVASGKVVRGATAQRIATGIPRGMLSPAGLTEEVAGRSVSAAQKKQYATGTRPQDIAEKKAGRGVRRPNTRG